MASESSHPSTKIEGELAGALLTVSALLLAFACYYAWSKNERKVQIPPGPKGLPLVGYLPFLKPDLHRFFMELARTYGPIFKVRLGTKLCVVVTSSPLAKEILRDHDTTFANRDVPAVALPLTYGIADVVFNPYGPEWRMLRKVCSREMMSSAVLDSYYALRRREVLQTVSDVHAKAGMPIDIGELTFLTALNVVTSMVWGGTLDVEGRRSMGVELRQATLEVVSLLGKPNVSDLFPVLARFDLQGAVRKMKGLSLWLDRIFDSVIDQRKKMVGREGGDGKSKDFLQLLLQLKESGDPKAPLTENNIKALFVDMVLGGTDTTSTTIEWCMSEMMQHPEIMRKAREELEEVVGIDHLVEESHLPKLSYLGAVLKEVLRLHPPVPLLVPRSPSQSCTVGGYMVPKGTRVMVNAWAMQRDPDAWEEPLEFRPERFLMEASEVDFNGHDFRYLPFGSGRRICVGFPLAERMLMYILASLLHSFEWQLPVGTKLDLEERFGIVLKKERPLIVIPTPRLSNLQLYSCNV